MHWLIDNLLEIGLKFIKLLVHIDAPVAVQYLAKRAEKISA
jgi:hypothetical protein